MFEIGEHVPYGLGESCDLLSDFGAELSHPSAAILAQISMGEAVARASSIVSAIPAVRDALLAMQRDFAAHPPLLGDGVKPNGAVLDGRDIGTAVCPDAALKLFVTATPEARARRRLRELQQRGVAAIYRDVLEDMKARDARDTERRVAPLAVAPDAVIIDTTELDADQVFERASKLIATALVARCGQRD